MIKALMSLASVAAVGIATAVGVPVAMAADSCPNAAVRAGVSAALPDCRAYELVSPDLNHASLGSAPNGYTTPDGNAAMYYSIDAPRNASFGSVWNFVVARRDPVTGWRGASILPQPDQPTGGYDADIPQWMSSDLTSVLMLSDTAPKGAPAPPPGQHLWVNRTDGSYAQITNVGNPMIGGIDFYQGWDTVASWNGLHDVFFRPALPQLPGDLPVSNMYHWRDGELHLLTVLPDGTAAPVGGDLVTAVRGQGAWPKLRPVSADGRQALFYAGGAYDGTDQALYLRSDDARTVVVDASRRTTVDPNPQGSPIVGGVTPDGSKVIFASKSELTNDAYTGRTGGVSTDAGRDLYSYDVASGDLTDLTVDTNPVDAATGASVQAIVATTPNAEYLYFTATGQLAPGAKAGHTSLYVLHGGRIDFIADADGMLDTEQDAVTDLTADGRTIAFMSRDRLTGYDNTDPVSGQPQKEVFVAGLDRTVECASCHPDGTPPTADSYLAGGTPYIIGSSARAISDDGERVFFESTDAVLPQASNGLSQVFQYSGGKVSLLSTGDGDSRAAFLDASASGDDVFIATHETLVPNPNGGDGAVYDARVNGGFAQPVKQVCDGAPCAPDATPPPVLPVVGTVTFAGEGNLPEVKETATGKVSTAKSLSVKGARASLKVKVPAGGKVTVSGSGLKSSTRTSSKAQTLTMAVALSSKSAKTLKKGKAVRIKAKVSFAPSAGSASSASVALTFKPATTKKGR
jgi:hypothetical protein